MLKTFEHKMIDLFVICFDRKLQKYTIEVLIFVMMFKFNTLDL